MSEPTPRKNRTVADPSRNAFLRLSGDVTRELNRACRLRVEEGESQAAIARSADQDPAFLSRMLGGLSGTNLRSIAAVLAATRHRLKVEAVPIEGLTFRKTERTLFDSSQGEVSLNFVKSAAGQWCASKEGDGDRSWPDEHVQSYAFIRNSDRV